MESAYPKEFAVLQEKKYVEYVAVEGLVAEVQRLKDLAEQSPENYDGLTVADLVLVKLGAV